MSLFILSAYWYPTKPVKLWTKEEAKALLGFVDRSDSKGKRDYAFMFLMVKYGIPVGDIFVSFKQTSNHQTSKSLVDAALILGQMLE